DPAHAAEHPFVTALEGAGVPVHCIVVGTRAYRAERQAVAQLMRAHKTDVLHTHGYRPDVIHGGVARSLGRAHVTTLHGFVGGSWRGRLYEWLQVRAAVRADAAIAVSAPIAARLARAGGAATTHLLRNAVAPDPSALPRDAARAALGLPADAFLVGWVGRLSHEKGPDVFLEALALAGDWAHGVIVGDGPLRESLVRQAQRHGIAHRLHFTGLRAQASRYLAAFDVLALTSRTEGTPMVLLEAMWAGVPIVATAVGGVPDVLGTDDALLCKGGDAVAIAQAFTTLSYDQELSLRLTRAARTRVTDAFSMNRWIDQHASMYREVTTFSARNV
ncbi:MAG: glycosyltransferase, partial [Gemmatimonadota bacterium]|nr:glycosyltransferase [Gemmatimonadota bacterium]